MSAGSRAAAGRFETLERLGRVTATGVTLGAWIAVHLRAPFGVTVAGKFTGAIAIYGSNSADPPDDSLAFDAYPAIGEVLTTPGAVGSSEIPYRWVRYRSDITSIDDGDHIDIDYAGYTPSGARGG